MALYKAIAADQLLVDDERARKVARLNAIQVVGSPGILLLARGAGLIATIKPRLGAMQSAGIHISSALLRDALRLAGEQANNHRSHRLPPRPHPIIRIPSILSSFMSIRLRPLLLAAAAAVLAGPLPAQSFVAEYPPVQGSDAVHLREWLIETGRVERLARWLNGWIRMPRRVALRMVECPSSDIRWNGEEHTVEMCYRMITRLYGIAEGQDSLVEAATGAHYFVTLHGVAHGIIDELNLPVGADPEAAVDELLALLLIRSARGDPGNPVFVLSGVATLQAADEGWGSWAYARNHGLEPERIRNVACLVYGSGPERFPSLRASGLVPDGARQRCRTAALRSVDVWSRRLGTYLR